MISRNKQLRSGKLNTVALKLKLKFDFLSAVSHAQQPVLDRQCAPTVRVQLQHYCT